MNAFRSVAPAVLTATLVVSGCSARKQVAPVAPHALSPEGKINYSFIFDPGNPALHLPTDVQFVRPVPVDTRTLPIYPEHALASRDGPHREIVRIVIDVHGNVGQVLDSPTGPSDDGPFAADYRRAVDAAVRTWRFQPGILWRFTGGPDKNGDGRPDYKVLTSEDPVAVYYDVRFTFEIVTGKGVVKVMP